MTVSRKHSKDRTEIKAIVEQIADELGREFGFSYHWDEDTLKFSRTGVNGYIQTHDDEIEVKINKSFFIPLSDAFLKAKVNEYMDSYLGCS